MEPGLSCIAFLSLLLYSPIFFVQKVHTVQPGEEDRGLDDTTGDAILNAASEAIRKAVDLGELNANSGDQEPPEAEEWITLADSNAYIAPLIAVLAVIHTMLSFSMLVAYYYLKVCFFSFQLNISNSFLFVMIRVRCVWIYLYIYIYVIFDQTFGGIHFCEASQIK